MFFKILQKVPPRFLHCYRDQSLLLKQAKLNSSKLNRLFSAGSKSSNLAKPETVVSEEVIQTQIKLSESLEINYGKIGQGSQVVLCIPGMLGTIETDFGPIMKTLDHSKFTVLSLDLPGYGKSKKSPRKLGKNPFEQDAVVVAALMETLEIPKYSIVGWGNGGATGLHLFSSSASKIEKFICWSTPAFLNRDTVKSARRMMDLKGCDWSPERWESMIAIYGKAEAQRMVKEFYMWVAKAERFNYYQVDPLLQACEVPTLILHGENDSTCSIEHPQRIHKGISNSILEVWPEGKHDLHLEFHDKFLERLEKFLLTSK